jgi:hypothetical protein
MYSKLKRHAEQDGVSINSLVTVILADLSARRRRDGSKRSVCPRFKLGVDDRGFR